MYLLAILLQSASEDGLGWSDLAGDLLTDPASLFTPALVVVGVVTTIRAGRSKPRGRRRRAAGGHLMPREPAAGMPLHSRILPGPASGARTGVACDLLPSLVVARSQGATPAVPPRGEVPAT